MASSLLLHEKIRTTVPKAKEVSRFTERLITWAKRDTLHARRQVARHLTKPEIQKKLFEVLGPRYQTRPGGYTRIVRLGGRASDNAPMGILQLVS